VYVAIVPDVDRPKVGGGLLKVVSPKTPKRVPERRYVEEGHVVIGGYCDGTLGSLPNFQTFISRVRLFFQSAIT